MIVDEASMLSLEICRHLIAGIAAKTHLVLIGDADQLPRSARASRSAS